MLIGTPRHYRAAKARAVQLGDPDRAAQADLGMRAAKAAQAIQTAVAGTPPLPADIIDALRQLLPPVVQEA